jgi:hypothetical protein
MRIYEDIICHHYYKDLEGEDYNGLGHIDEDQCKGDEIQNQLNILLAGMHVLGSMQGKRQYSERLMYQHSVLSLCQALLQQYHMGCWLTGEIVHTSSTPSARTAGSPRLPYCHLNFSLPEYLQTIHTLLLEYCSQMLTIYVYVQDWPKAGFCALCLRYNSQRNLQHAYYALLEDFANPPCLAGPHLYFDRWRRSCYRNDVLCYCKRCNHRCQ